MTTDSPYSDFDIAIVGMACRLPGADDLEAFWQLIREGRSALRPAPEDRFDRSLFYHPDKGVLGKSYTDLGGLVTYRPVDDIIHRLALRLRLIAQDDSMPENIWGHGFHILWRDITPAI